VVARLECDVIVDEDIPGVQGAYAMDLAIADDGAVHAIWDAGPGLRAVRRTGAQEWQRVDDPFAGLTFGALHLDMAGGGRAAPVLSIRTDSYDDSSIWRWRDGAWHEHWRTVSDTGGNQGVSAIAIAPDATVHCSMAQDVFDERYVGLFELSAGAADPVERDVLDGRDPLIGVDASGARHVVFADGSHPERSLNYLGPDGDVERVIDEHDGWPRMAVADDGAVHVYAESGENAVLLARTTDGAWASNAVPDTIHAECEEYGSWDESREGERCRHLAHSLERVVLLGGPRVLLVAEQIHEEGDATWTCVRDHGAYCSWVRDDDFVETHTMVVGAPTSAGVELVPLPIALPDGLRYDWGFAGDQDGEGQPHLLLHLVDGEAERLRYVGLECTDEV